MLAWSVRPQVSWADNPLLHLGLVVGWSLLGLLSLYRYRYRQGSKVNMVFFLSAVLGWIGYSSVEVLDWLGAPFIIGVGIPAVMLAFGLSGFGYGLYVHRIAG